MRVLGWFLLVLPFWGEMLCLVNLLSVGCVGGGDFVFWCVKVLGVSGLGWVLDGWSVC